MMMIRRDRLHGEAPAAGGEEGLQRGAEPGDSNTNNTNTNTNTTNTNNNNNNY